MVIVAACSGSASSDGAQNTTGSDGGQSGSTPAPTGRIVALGEERVLADLLALDVRPVASTANVIVDGGFVGLDEFDTTGIEPLPSDEPNIERLAALKPDVIVANEFVVDYLGRDVLESLGEVIVVPDGDTAAQVRALGDAFDRREKADALVQQLDDALAQGRATLSTVPEDERSVSVLTVYSGPAVAAWVDGPVDTPATLLALGYTLDPGPDDVAGATGGATEGRAYLSEEQLGLFDAPTIVAMQTEFVDGEGDALAAVESNPLWAELPAVRAGRVITVDRLGYPGISGQIRLVGDLVDKLGA